MVACLEICEIRGFLLPEGWWTAPVLSEDKCPAHYKLSFRTLSSDSVRCDFPFLRRSAEGRHRDYRLEGTYQAGGTANLSLPCGSHSITLVWERYSQQGPCVNLHLPWPFPLLKCSQVRVEPGALDLHFCCKVEGSADTLGLQEDLRHRVHVKELYSGLLPPHCDHLSFACGWQCCTVSSIWWPAGMERERGCHTGLPVLTVSWITRHKANMLALVPFSLPVMFGDFSFWEFRAL